MQRGTAGGIIRRDMCGERGAHGRGERKCWMAGENHTPKRSLDESPERVPALRRQCLQTRFNIRSLIMLLSKPFGPFEDQVAIHIQCRRTKV